MSIGTENAYNGPYEANGVTTEFPFDFSVLADTQVAVKLIDTDGSETVVDAADYSVTLNGAVPTDGTVIFGAAPASGQVIVLLDLPFTQETEFVDGSAWKAGPVNNVNDRAALRDQILKRETDRAIKAPIGDTVDLPPAAQRANKFLGFDGTGALQMNAGPIATVIDSSVTVIDTAAGIPAASFDVSIDRISTRGFAAVNDGGAAVYQRTTETLAAGGEDIWWFTADDASKWKIVAAPEHFAAQFGALGGSGIDVRPILNTALASGQVSVINLGPLTHYMTGATSGTYSVKIPSGKGLRGVSKSLSWLKLVPVTLGAQATAIQTIYFEDDTGGFAEDFSLDCQRSGVGGGMNDRVSGVTIRAKSANGKGTRVRRVDVYNATGYGHYESADSGRTLRQIQREDCRSFNCGVGFETTGNSEVKSIDCYVDASATPWDGGSLIACEAMYHEYGAISRVERIRCRGYGQAGAGFFPVTVGANIGTIIYGECYCVVTNAVPALNALGQSGYVINDLRVFGGEFTSANADGAIFTKTTAQLHDTKLYGGYDADTGGGNGAGANVSTDAVVDFYQCDIKGRSDNPGAGAAYGIFQQGTGVARLHGGKVEAIGPSGLMNALGGTVTVVLDALLTPAVAGVGTALPNYRQRKRGTATGWTLYNPGTPEFSWINIVLDTAVSSRALTDVVLTLQDADGATGVVPNDLSLTFNWQSDTTIQVQVPPGVTTTDLTLKYSIIEWVS